MSFVPSLFRLVMPFALRAVGCCHVAGHPGAAAGRDKAAAQQTRDAASGRVAGSAQPALRRNSNGHDGPYSLEHSANSSAVPSTRSAKCSRLRVRGFRRHLLLRRDPYRRVAGGSRYPERRNEPQPPRSLSPPVGVAFSRRWPRWRPSLGQLAVASAITGAGTSAFSRIAPSSTLCRAPTRADERPQPLPLIRAQMNDVLRTETSFPSPTTPSPRRGKRDLDLIVKCNDGGYEVPKVDKIDRACRGPVLRRMSQNSRSRCERSKPPTTIIVKPVPSGRGRSRKQILFGQGRWHRTLDGPDPHSRIASNYVECSQ